MATRHTIPLVALVVPLLLFLLCSCAGDGTIGDSDIRGGPSISAAAIDQILSAAGSPAVGLGATLYQLSEQYQIDDAYPLAFFDHESSYGTQGVARFTHGFGNIRCVAWPTCYQGFRSYTSWRQGAADWYQLIATYYLPSGRTTVSSIVAKYAPSSDGNSESDYVQAVLADVSRYHSHSNS
jgi:hypothetical protein